MERIKNSLINGMVDILLKIGKVAAKSLVIVPLLYLFPWLTWRHFPSHEQVGFLLVGGLMFTDVSDKVRQRLFRRFHAVPHVPAEPKPL